MPRTPARDSGAATKNRGSPRSKSGPPSDIKKSPGAGKQARPSLKKNHQPDLLDRIFEHTHDCIVLLDRDFNFIRVNKAYADICGRAVEEFPGHNHFEFYPSPLIEEFRKVVATGNAYHAFSRAFTFPDHPEWGDTYWDLSLISIPDKDGEVKNLLFTLKDVTYNVRADRSSKRFDRILDSIYTCNLLMVRANDERELLRWQTQLLVEIGGYCTAWVGYAMQDEQKTIVPQAYAGEGEESFQKAKFSWGRNKYGRGSAGRAIRNAQTIIEHGIAQSECSPRCDRSMNCSYSSCIALPLCDEEKVYGVLSIYSDKPDAFHDEEVKLLGQLAQDLSYGINNMRTSVKRNHAEKKLDETEHRFSLILDNAADAVYIANPEGYFTYANHQAANMLGYSRQELLSMAIADITPADNLENEMQQFHQLKANGTLRKETRQKHRDGSIIPVELNAVQLPDGSFYGSCRDISEFKHTEKLVADYVKQLADYVQQLEDSMQGTLQAVSNMIEQRDPYTAGHERRVGRIAADIAKEMGYPEKKCKELQLIGLVHDIGKIGIPAEILSKPGRLTDMEYGLVKGHVEKGYEILKDVKFPMPIAEIIRQHHERMDGSGYPHGLIGDQILPEARILAVADIMESMSSHRPYRPALGIQPALDELTQNRGKLYDASVVDALLTLINENGYKLPS